MSKVHLLDKTVCILLHTKALGKGRNPSLLPTSWERQPAQKETEFKPAVLCLKTNPVSHSARARSVWQIYIFSKVNHRYSVFLFLLSTTKFPLLITNLYECVTKKKKRVKWPKVWFVWFYGISTFVGYLTPNPFLCK